MMDEWALWLLLVGLAVGGATIGVLLVRLPRAEDDIGPDEHRAEAAWIAGTIERHGGIAPPSFVEDVLELHAAYRQLQRPPVPPGATMLPPPPQGPIPPQGPLPPPQGPLPPPRQGPLPPPPEGPLPPKSLAPPPPPGSR